MRKAFQNIHIPGTIVLLMGPPWVMAKTAVNSWTPHMMVRTVNSLIWPVIKGNSTDRRMRQLVAPSMRALSIIYWLMGLHNLVGREVS